MSDHAQGAGWWLASDGRWYPPATHEQPSVTEPVAATPTEPTPEWNGTTWVTRGTNGEALEWNGSSWAAPTPTTVSSTSQPATAPAAPAREKRKGAPVKLIAIVVVFALVIAGIAIVLKRGSSDAGTTVGSGPVSGADELPSDQVKLTDAAVVVRGNGGKSLKSVESDGTTFHLDAGAEGMDKVQPGKVLLLTGMFVVKVKEAERRGDEVVIKTESAAITDVISDGDISWSGQRASSGSISVYDPTDENVEVQEKGAKPDEGGKADEGATPSASSLLTDRNVGPQQSAERSLKSGNSAAPGGARLLAASPLLADGASGKGSFAGFDYSYSKGDNGGSTDTYHLTVTKNREFKLLFNVDAEVGDIITEGRIKVEKSTMNAFKIKSNTWEGKAKATFEAGVGDSPEPIRTTIFSVPVSVNYPIVIYGIPFNLNVTAKLLIEPAFSSKNSVIKGEASVTFGGTAGFTFEDGKVDVDGAVTAEAPDPLSYLKGLGVGVNGMVVGFNFPRIGFGLGWAGTNVGAYISNIVTVGATVGSSIGLVQCFGVTVTYVVKAGIEAKFAGINIPGMKDHTLPKGVDQGLYSKELKRQSWNFLTPKVKVCEGADGGGGGG